MMFNEYEKDFIKIVGNANDKDTSNDSYLTPHSQTTNEELLSGGGGSGGGGPTGGGSNGSGGAT